MTPLRTCQNVPEPGALPTHTGLRHQEPPAALGNVARAWLGLGSHRADDLSVFRAVESPSTQDKPGHPALSQGHRGAACRSSMGGPRPSLLSTEPRDGQAFKFRCSVPEIGSKDFRHDLETVPIKRWQDRPECRVASHRQWKTQLSVPPLANPGFWPGAS